MQGKHDKEKGRKPRLLIPYVGFIARQYLLDISDDWLVKITGV